MKNYKKYIIWSLTLLCFSTTFAQNMPWKERRLFNLSIYNAIESYEKYGVMFDENDGHYFTRLFKSDEVIVYNDLLGLSVEKNMSVSDYVRILTDDADLVDLFIRNVRIGQPYNSDGSWMIDVEFNKEIGYYNNAGIRISSKVHYGAEYDMKATFEWDSHLQQAKLVAINGNVNSNTEPLPMDYFAVERCATSKKDGIIMLDPRDLEVLCNGEKLNFIDTYNQAVIPNTIENIKLVYPHDTDVKVKLTKSGEVDGLYHIKYKPTHWRVKLHYDFSFGDSYVIDIENKDINTKISSNEFGLDFGYMFPSSSKFKIGFFAGAGIAKNSFDLNLNSFKYSIDTKGSADIDGDKYTRHYSLKNINQSYNTTDVVIPVYVDLEYHLSNIFSMYADVGVKSYMNIDSESSDFNAEYSVYGQYTQYDNLILDYRSGINGFVENAILKENNTINDFKPETLTFDAYASLGFRFKIYKGLQFNCGLAYQMGLNDYVKPSENIVDLANSKANANNAIMIYSAAEDKEIVRNLLETATSFKRQSLKLNVGLILKF